VLDKAGQVSCPAIPTYGGPSLLSLQNIETRDLSNNIIKTVKCPVQTNDIFYGGTASLILASTTSVVLFDIQQQKVLAELTTPPVKYVVWSTDGNNVALLSKHSKLPFSVTLADVS
jgi:coatomer protein complex subunit alpha (xenin)